MELPEKWALLKRLGPMAYDNNQIPLLIIGVHLSTEGYPNTLYRLRDLETTGLFQISKINFPMWHNDTQNRQGFSRLTRNFFKALIAHFGVITCYLAETRPKRVYVPYPAVFVIFLISWLPKWLRPQYLVADVFISLYDTIVFDRQLLKTNGYLARLLHWVEKRAYKYADKLLVDTRQNAQFLCSMFNLPDAKILALPLSSNESDFKCRPYHPKNDICCVLFVGTLIPLHGIETILEAAQLVSNHSNIHFKLIGDGQNSSIVKNWLKNYSLPLTWERNWLPSTQIADEISQADICLGIFGAGDKTQRVCPFKIYAYAAIGRAIITGETDWLKDTTSKLPYEPFAKVPVNNARLLADKIIQLANNPTLRTEMATNSQRFYQAHLENRLALDKLTDCLLER